MLKYIILISLILLLVVYWFPDFYHSRFYEFWSLTLITIIILSILSKLIKQKLDLRFPEINQTVLSNQTALFSIAIIFTSLFFTIAFQVSSISSTMEALSVSNNNQVMLVLTQGVFLSLQLTNPTIDQNIKNQLIITLEEMKKYTEALKSLAESQQSLSTNLSKVVKILFFLSIFSVSGILTRILYIFLPNIVFFKEYADLNLILTISMYLFSLLSLLILF